MRRKAPKSPPKVERRQDGMIRETRRYKLITPLFGGGVETQKADPVTVVRGTEVRGHLRFWWRATRGGQPKFNGELAKMKAEEERIWGSAAGKDRAGPSPVHISVEVERRGNERTLQQIDSEYQTAYLTFPLRETPNAILRVDVVFTVSITVSPGQAISTTERDVIWKDVQAALWAWETFGGIGARTRRGFGAMTCIGIDDSPYTLPARSQMWKAIQEGIQTHVSDGTWHKNVPHLQQQMSFEILTANNAKDAWKELIFRLRNFRQDRGGKGYGKSKWPEPEAVYDLLQRPAKRPRPTRVIQRFPRAQFGLPMQFEFPQHPDGPGKSMLSGMSKDRLASPLILRPLMCRDGAIGLAAILSAPRFVEGGLTLTETTTKKARTVQAEIDKSDASQIDPLDGETNALEAFLNAYKWR